MNTSIISKPVFRIDSVNNDGEAIALLISKVDGDVNGWDGEYRAVEWMDTQGNDVVDLTNENNHTHGGHTWATVELALQDTIASVENDDGEYTYLVDPALIVEALA